MIAGLLSLIGSGVSGFFGLKGKQADVVTKSLDVINNVNSRNTTYASEQEKRAIHYAQHVPKLCCAPMVHK